MPQKHVLGWLLVGCFALAAVPALAVSVEELQGDWQVTVIEGEPTPPMIEVTMRFDSNGVGEMNVESDDGHSEAMTFNYELDGDVLTMTPLDDPDDTVTFDLVLEDTRLLMTDVDSGSESVMERMP